MAIRTNVGDILLLRATRMQASVPQPPLHISVQIGNHPPIWVEESTVVHVEPQPLKVGDRVVSNNGFLGTINGIDAYHAWVKAESKGYGSIVALAQLKRADEPRPLKVGDKVRHKSGWFGTIEVCDAGNAMIQVRVGNGGGSCNGVAHVLRSELERVE